VLKEHGSNFGDTTDEGVWLHEETRNPKPSFLPPRVPSPTAAAASMEATLLPARRAAGQSVPYIRHCTHRAGGRRPLACTSSKLAAPGVHLCRELWSSL